MVTTLVDTSALFAILDRDDPQHSRASAWFGEGRDQSERLVTHNYIALESAALVRGRLGGEAVAALFDSLLGSIRVMFVDEPLHRAAVAAHLARPAHPSLVDQVSFRFMRDRGIQRAFAFDKDFEREGFEVLP
jgi:predicted nucleic acid-binding protein